MAQKAATRGRSQSNKKGRSTQSRRLATPSTGLPRVLIFIVVLIVGVFFVIQFARMYQRNQAYIEQEEALTQQLQELQEQQEILEEEEAYVSTWEYVQEVARQKLQLFNSNDIIFREE